MLSDRLMEAFGDAVEPAPGRQGDAPAATILEEDRDRGATRLGGGALITLRPP